MSAVLGEHVDRRVGMLVTGAIFFMLAAVFS